MIACAACGTANPGGSRFCNGCGASLGDSPIVRREERKVVTVVFVDLVGSTARADGADPEDVRAVLAPYHALLRRELEAHGGTVEKFIGDAAVAVFGAPIAHEDDPERAVRAALAILDAIADLNDGQPDLELRVRIGVNTGEALVALEARPEAGEGMVSGDVMNTAARLQSAAPVGGILVDEQTRRATERVIEYAEYPAVEAKGKAEDVPASLAVARRSSFGVDDADVGEGPLVGREREVALLRDALARVTRDRRAQLLTLVGVPGIGKSRLVQELRAIVDADAELITWRRGRSLPYGEGVTYWALGEILKAQAGILESDGAEETATKLGRAVRDLVPDERDAAWVERTLRPLVGLSGADLASREEAFAGWRALLDALAEQRPLVLVLEDLHWADDDLLDFVDALVDELDDVPLLLVCTARPELLARRPGWGGGKLNALTLSLAPLSDEETALLLHERLHRAALPADVQEQLVRRSGGVPLFAEEYARMLEGGEKGGDGLPDTLQGLVAARVDGLGPREKALLQNAAVLGKVFWTDALATLSGLGADELAERLRVLERLEFVRRERRSMVEGARQHVFLHALVRDVAYGQMPRAARSAKHRLAADWMDALPADRAAERAEMLAHHLGSAISYGEAAGIEVDDLRPRLVAALWEAGDRAGGLNVVGRAADLYARAIAAHGPGDAVDPVLRLRHARAQMWSEGIAGERPAFEEAIEGLLEAGKVELAATAMLELERLLWNANAPEPALLERALALVSDSDDEALRGQVLAGVAVRWAIGGRGEEALPLALEAVAIARRREDPTAEATALNTLGVVQSTLGDLLAGAETCRRALELALAHAPADLGRCYVNLATYELELGNLEESSRLFRDGHAYSTRAGSRFQAEWIDAELVVTSFALGEWDDALRGATAFLDARAASGVTHVQSALMLMTLALLRSARSGEVSHDEVARVVEMVRELGEPQWIAPVLGDVVALHGAAGRVEEAAAILRELTSLGDEVGGSLVGSWDVAAAIGAVRLGLRRPRDLGASHPSSWARAARAISDGDAAAAADILAEMGARTAEAETRLLAAEMLVDRDPGEALRQLDLAAAFWRSVEAHARLRALEDVRRRLDRAAS